MKINIKSLSGNVPTYETEDAAGMDISACIDETIILKPGKRTLVPTGLYIELPRGYEAQIRARSGLAVKKGIGLVNGVGTVDADYRGEIKVPLINWGEEDFIIKNGDRIAQMVITKYERVELTVVEDLNETKRGTGGFGSTGV